MNRLFYIAMILLLGACSFPHVQKHTANALSNPFLTSHSYTLENVPKDARTMIFAAAAIKDLKKLQFDWLKMNAEMTKDLYPGYSMVTIDGPNQDNRKISLRITNTVDQAQSSLYFTFIPFKGKNKETYCDPNALPNGNGSKERPYRSLQSLMESGYEPISNEVIYLLNGNHGTANLHGGHYTIAAASGHAAVLNAIHITNGKNILVHSIRIESRMPVNSYLLTIDTLSEEIIIQNCKITCTVSDDELHQKNWKEYVASGIYCDGNKCRIHGNLIQYTFHGLQTNGNQNIISNNIIDRFCGDAIRNTGNDNQFLENFLSNALIDDYYDPTGNHDDLLQAWTHDSPILNIIIKKNIAISTTDPDLPNRSKIVQGLVCFDGFTENWVVDSNIVVTDHPHGISLYGAKHCTIKNNIVLRNPHKFYDFESDPWIMIHDHKDKRMSEHNKVISNVATKYNIPSTSTIIKDNTTIDSIYLTNFIKYHGWIY